MTGCQNAYSQFYTPVIKEPLKPTDKVSYYTYSSEDELYTRISKGYLIIGYSSFTSTETATKEEAISQAKKVGADTVMATWKYQNTENQTVPISNYTPGTTTTTYSNNTYGYGTSTTSYTPGTYYTSYIQSTAHRYSYTAYYLQKFDTSRLTFGATYIDTTAEMKQRIGTNAGCQIITVFENTPAYNNDIVNNDIILKINNYKISSCREMDKMMNKYNIVSLNILRNGNIIDIKDIKQNK